MLDIHTQTAADGDHLLRLEGELTVATATPLREALLKGLAEQERLQVDCSMVTAIDFFGIQLLCSAHRSALAWGKSLSWHGTLPPVITEATHRIGFARHHGCVHCPADVRCMWT